MIHFMDKNIFNDYFVTNWLRYGHMITDSFYYNGCSAIFEPGIKTTVLHLFFLLYLSIYRFNFTYAEVFDGALPGFVAYVQKL